MEHRAMHYLISVSLCVHVSICFVLVPASKTKRLRKTENGVNVSQIMRKRCAKCQVRRSQPPLGFRVRVSVTRFWSDSRTICQH